MFTYIDEEILKSEVQFGLYWIYYSKIFDKLEAKEVRREEMIIPSDRLFRRSLLRTTTSA